MSDDRIERERDHWDHVISSPDEVVSEFEAGPDPNTAHMLKAVNPGPGRHILDFACGGGVTSLWLAAQGATVTGIDLSPKSIEVATEAAAVLELPVRFMVADLERHALPSDGYDGLVGRYALHHLDVAALAPALARAVKPGESAAFVETMATNPVLRVARNHMLGRLGIPRYGTLDEHPLVEADLQELRDAFGSLELTTVEFRFLSLFDRQVLKYRNARVSSVLSRLDGLLANTRLGQSWGYHQVLVATRVEQIIGG